MSATAARAVRITAFVAAAVCLGVLVGSGRTSLLLLTAGVALAGLCVALFPLREGLLLGWIALAPFMQEIARSNPIGNALNYGLYLFGGLAVCVWGFVAFVRLLQGRPRLADLAPAGFVIVTGLSLAFATLIPIGWTKMDLLRQAYGNIVLPAAAFYVALRGVSRSIVGRYLRVLWAVGAVVGSMAIYEAVTGWNLWQYERWQSVDIGRVVGPLGNPAVLGTLLGVCFVSVLAYVVWAPARRPEQVVVALTCGMIALAGTWFTYARASLVAVVVAASLVIVLKSKARWATVLVLVIVAVLLVGSWGALSESRVIQDRFGNRSNAEVRLLLAAWSLELARSKPVVGWGYGSFNAAKGRATGTIPDIPTAYAANDTSHNSLLTVLVETGAVGMLLFVVAWLAIGWRFVRSVVIPENRTWYAFALAGGAVVYVVNAMFIDMRFFSLPALLGWWSLGLLGFVLRDPADDDAAVSAQRGTG
jgi:O-antigen ligase